MKQRLKQLSGRHMGSKQGSLMQKTTPGKFPQSDPKWNYRIKFDSSLGLEEAWVDSQTLDFINTFRENIYVS